MGDDMVLHWAVSCSSVSVTSLGEVMVEHCLCLGGDGGALPILKSST